MVVLTGAGDTPERYFAGGLGATVMGADLRRREFISALGAAAALPVMGTAAAQQSGKTARIGYLSAGSAPDLNIESFRHGMVNIGHVEGRDFVIEARYAGRDYRRFNVLVDELLRAKVDLIITGGPATQAAPLASRSVPVVFSFSGDPVAAGIVASFARPGGNATGISFLALDLAAKRVDLLKEAVPPITRIAVLANPDHAGELSEQRATREAARAHGLTIQYYQVRDDDSFEPAFSAVAEARCDALLAFPDALTNFHRNKIAQFAIGAKLPSIFAWKLFIEAGGLMSYGPVLRDAYVRLAYFVDKILKGAKPSELAVEQPTRLELAVNLKTAMALGVTIPPSILLRADEMIE